MERGFGEPRGGREGRWLPKAGLPVVVALGAAVAASERRGEHGVAGATYGGRDRLREALLGGARLSRQAVHERPEWPIRHLHGVGLLQALAGGALIVAPGPLGRGGAIDLARTLEGALLGGGAVVGAAAGGQRRGVGEFDPVLTCEEPDPGPAHAVPIPEHLPGGNVLLVGEASREQDLLEVLGAVEPLLLPGAALAAGPLAVALLERVVRSGAACLWHQRPP